VDLKHQAAIIVFALVSATAPQQADAACAGPFKFPAIWHLRQSNAVILTCRIIPNGIEGGVPVSFAIKYKFLGSCANSESDQGTTRVEINGVGGEFVETLSMTVDWRNDSQRTYTGWLDSRENAQVHDTKIDPPTFPIFFSATWTSDPLICPNEAFEPPSCSSCHNNETRQWHEDLRKNGAALDQRPSGVQPRVR